MLSPDQTIQLVHKLLPHGSSVSFFSSDSSPPFHVYIGLIICFGFLGLSCFVLIWILKLAAVFGFRENVENRQGIVIFSFSSKFQQLNGMMGISWNCPWMLSLLQFPAFFFSNYCLFLHYFPFVLLYSLVCCYWFSPLSLLFFFIKIIKRNFCSLFVSKC